MVAALAVGALLAARVIPVDAVHIFAGLALQQVLDARAKAQARRARAYGLNRRLRVKGVVAVAEPGGPSDLRPAVGADLHRLVETSSPADGTPATYRHNRQGRGANSNSAALAAKRSHRGSSPQNKG